MVKKSTQNKSKAKIVTSKVKSAQKSAAAANLLRKRKRSVSPVAVSSKKVKSTQAVKKAKHVSRSATPERTEKGKKSKKIEKTKNGKKADKIEKGKGNKKSQVVDKKVKNGKSSKQEKVQEKVKTPKPAAIKKKKTDAEKIDLPADISAVVVQTLLNVNHRVSADKIVELIKEDYKNVSEVLVHSAVGDLFRQGKLTEAKSLFALDEDVLVQLNPPKAPEVVPEPEQEDAIEIEVEAPVAEVEAVPTQETAVEAEQPATTETLPASAQKSAAKSVTKSASKSVTKQSVGKESVPKTNLSQLAQEEFADKVISSSEAEALQVLNDN